mmetsp:Transcript_32130/g.102418  ORF Transcript_32130/g.102418 Transcript_32130/m.102418 type:complete len:221 (+) Transcript_32130:62-724(+)
MGFLLPHVRGTWDPLLQRSAAPRAASRPSSLSPGKLLPPLSAAGSEAAGRVVPVQSPRPEVSDRPLKQTPAERSRGGGLEEMHTEEELHTGGTRATAGGESSVAPTPAPTGSSAATPRSLEAESLALAWRLQQLEQEALHEAITANSPMPVPGGGGGFGANADGPERMETEGDEDASLRLAIRLQQEELQWHQMASRRTLEQAGVVLHGPSAASEEGPAD